MSVIADIHKDMENGAVRLIAEYRSHLFSDAVHLCNGNVADAEDLVSQTLVKVINKIDHYKNDDNFYGWMKTIMINTHNDNLSRPVNRRTDPTDSKILEQCAGVDTSTDEQILIDSDHDVLRQALSQLEPEYRDAISLYYFNELSLCEIARLMGTSTSTISRRIALAKRILAARLQKKLGRKPVVAIVALLLGLSTVFGGWKAAEALGWLPAEEAPRTEEVQVAAEEEATAEEETAEAQPAVEGTISSDSNLTQKKGTTTMNLKAVKSVAAAAATVLTLSATAEPVTPVIPASTYIQDGLVVHFDGIENAGAGLHDSTANDWVDLAGLGGDMSVTTVVGRAWLNNALTFESSAGASATDTTKYLTIPNVLNLGDNFTFQVFCNTGDLADSCRRWDLEPRPNSLYESWSSVAEGFLERINNNKLSLNSWRENADILFTTAVGNKKHLFQLNQDGVIINAVTGNVPSCAINSRLAFFKKVSTGRTAYAIRVYNRALTAQEIAWNDALDQVRFEGVDPSTIDWPDGVRWNSEKGALEYRVTVTSTAVNPVSVNDGGFTSATNAWCELGASVVVKCQVGEGYRLVRWDGVPEDAVEDENQVTFTVTGPMLVKPVLAFDMPASAYIQDGLIAQWDAIDNAGTGTHDPSATAWVDLTGGESWALQAKGSFSENAFVCAGGGVAATRTAAMMSVQTMDIRFEQTARPGGIIFGAGQRTGGYSCFIGYNSNGTQTDIVNVGRVYSFRTELGVPQTAAILYNLENDLYSTPPTAYYRDGVAGSLGTEGSYYGDLMNNATLGARSNGTYPFIGNIYALRLYNRKLTDTEIGINAAIDKVRFENADPVSDIWPDGVRWNSEKGALECRVTVTSTAANPVSINNGAFVAETNAWFDLGVSVTVKCQVADGYHLARWEGAPKDAVVGENQITFAAATCSITPAIGYNLSAKAYAQKGLVEQWDGIENVGYGLPHDSAQRQWMGLVKGRIFTFVDKDVLFDETSLKCRAGNYQFADCTAITTNDFDVLDGFVYQDTVRASGFYASLFSANSRAIWGWDGGLAVNKTTAYVSTHSNPLGSMSVYAAYEHGKDVPTAISLNGEQLTTPTTVTGTFTGENKFMLGVRQANASQLSYRGLRLYNRELTETEQAVNRFVDQIRYDYVEPSTLSWPDGVRWQNGKLETRLTITFDDTKGSVTVNGESITSGEPIWVAFDKPVTLVATANTGSRLRMWSGYYFDDLPTFTRQSLSQTFVPSVSASDLTALFVGENDGIWIVPTDFPTLADALESSDVVDGDMIRIASGEHTWGKYVVDNNYTYLAVVRKAVKIEGVGGADAVTLNCDGNGGILLDHPDAILSGVTFVNFTTTNRSSRVLLVTQGVASNIVANGASRQARAVVNVFRIESNGTLMDSAVCYVTNSSSGSGVAIELVGGVMQRTKIYNNSWVGRQGLLTTSLSGVNRPQCEDCEFYGNKYSTAIITCAASDFINNRIYNNTGDGRILNCGSYAKETTFNSCVITNNDATSGANSLLYIGTNTKPIVFTNCLIAANASYSGGLVDLSSGNELVFANCTVSGNKSKLGDVAGFVKGAGTVTLRNTIFRGNLNQNGVEAEFAELPNVTFIFDHSCYTGRSIEEGSIDEDPKFKDAAAGDYMLDKGSPCVDTGVDIAALTWDLAGNKRPVDGDGDGSAITDMGCYEKPEPTEALEVALDVEVENDCAPGQATLTATVTGTRTTGLKYQWYAICTVGENVTTNITGWIEDATYTFTNLGVGLYAFGCNVMNDATPPDTAKGEGKNAVRILPEITYVSTTGDDEGNFPYDTEEKAAGTLATAYANAGRKVVILPGTYTFDHAVDETTGLDCQLAVRRAITIMGKGAPSEVVLDCNGSNAFIVDHAQAKVSGLTLTNFLVTAGRVRL